MKALKYIAVLVLLLSLIVPTAFSEEEPNMPDIGTLYGDLYVILRDEGGAPILSADGCIQPISSVTASVDIDILDEYGEEDTLTVSVEEGEPFGLPTYTDTAGDLVECELTEDMAEWVQAVDFGRLNLGRAPDSVIAHAFDEAINKMNVAQAIGIDPSGRLILTIPDEEDGWVAKTVDAPAENLALYIKMMLDGHWITTNTDPVEPGGSPIDDGGNQDDQGKMPDGVGPFTEDRPVLSPEAAALLPVEYQGLGDATRASGEDLTREELLLAASLLAAAADKTGNMTLDKVVYINSIYGINQNGTWPGPTEDETYFNFWLELGDPGSYDRASHYEYRSSGGCQDRHIWVLQPELVLYDPNPDDEDPGELVPVGDHYVTECMDILGYELGTESNAVHFTHMAESYDTVDPDYLVFDSNVRGFVQASEDALRVLEYLHNYKTPEDLYGVYPDQ